MKEDKDVVKFVEENEIARNAWSTKAAGTADFSNFRKSSRAKDEDSSAMKAKLALKGNCSKCGVQISLYIRYRGGHLNKTPFHMCAKCHKETAASMKSNNQGSGGNGCEGNSRKPDGPSESSAISSWISALADTPHHSAQPSVEPSESSNAHSQAIVLDHHIFTPGGWQKAPKLKHPTLRLRISTHEEDYKEFSVPYPKIAPK